LFAAATWPRDETRRPGPRSRRLTAVGVLHLYQPASGVIIAVAANSGVEGPDDQLPGLAVTVFQTLQAAGALTAQ